MLFGATRDASQVATVSMTVRQNSAGSRTLNPILNRPFPSTKASADSGVAVSGDETLTDHVGALGNRRPNRNR